MSDVAFDWVELRDGSVRLTYFDMTTHARPSDDADLIPDWAAIAVLMGAILATVGFVATWVTEEPWAPILLTLGLIIAVIGMRAAEKAVNIAPKWRPLKHD